MEPRSRPAATTRYHKDWQRKTDNHFHSSADIDSLPPRSVDKHNHGGINRRFLHGKRPDGRFSRNYSCQRPDKHHSLLNAQYASSDYNNTALRHDSGLQQYYSEHHTSGNVLSTRQDRQHHNSSSHRKRPSAQHYTSDVNKQTGHSSTDNYTAQHRHRMQHVPVHNTDTGHVVLVVAAFLAVHPVTFGNNRVVSGSPMEGIPHDPSSDTVQSRKALEIRSS